MKKFTRRELIKSFGVSAFLLHPVLRSMAMAAGTEFKTAPRFISIFKGGGFVPDSFFPSDINNLTGKVIEPLQAFSKDIVLFKNLNMGNGNYGDEDGRYYGDEHGGGMNICFTGGRVYGFSASSGDSYYWGTYDMSVDQRIAQYYQTQPDLKTLAFPSLQLGVGVNSIDRGQIFISHVQGAKGQAPQANGLAPIQDPLDAYNKIIGRITGLCQGQTTQPSGDQLKRRAFLERNLSLVDFQMETIRDAKRKLGLDSEHSIRLDGLVQSFRDIERQTQSELATIGGGGGGGTGKPCPNLKAPNRLTSSELRSLSIDQLKPRIDTMIALIKLSFEWDLTRVVSFMLTTGSNEQTYSSAGAPDSHHSYAHGSNVSKLMIMDKYHVEKVRDLMTALQSITDPDGKTALFNSSIVVGMDTFNGPLNGSIIDHSKRNMPFILAGQGGGRLSTGRIVDAAGRAHNDLLISCLQASGINTNTFGKPEYCKGPLI